MFSIGELSKQTGVKIPTIRYYEKMGLIDMPDRSIGNQRRYSQQGLERLASIRHARDLGFSISDIRELNALSQHLQNPCGDAHGIAARHLESVKARIAKLKRLERELKRIAACKADSISQCAVIETLANHALCEGEH